MAPLSTENQSLFHLERISQYVSLPPLSLNTPLPAICASVFSPLLLTYYPPARGIVLSYQNVQLSEEPPKKHRAPQQSQQQNGTSSSSTPLLMRVVDEYSTPFIWATADLLVWRPRKGAWIEGRITHQSSTHITLSYLNALPVVILKSGLPSDWNYHGAPANTFSMTGGSKTTGGAASGEGYWGDADGMPIGEGGVLGCWIGDWDGRIDGGLGAGKAGGVGTLRIEGTLLGGDGEAVRVVRKETGGEVVEGVEEVQRVEGESETKDKKEKKNKEKKKKKSALKKSKIETDGDAMEVD